MNCPNKLLTHLNEVFETFDQRINVGDFKNNAREITNRGQYQCGCDIIRERNVISRLGLEYQKRYRRQKQ